MLDGNAMLVSSGYFLGYPRLCLIRARKTKVAKSDLAASSIGVISTRDVSVWSIFGGPVFAGGASAEGICIDAGLSGIGSWL